MGRSWVLTITLDVPDRRRWLATTPDPSAFDDWPPLLEATPRRVPKLSVLLGRLAKDRFARVSWQGETLRVEALSSHDSSFWADARVPLAAAVRASGGEGELAIVNASDNTEETAIVVTTDGVRTLTGKPRAALGARLREVAHAIVAAELERDAAARRREPLVRDERLRPLHNEVLRALEGASEPDLLAAAATIERTLSLVEAPGAPTYASFGDLFRTKPSLLVALAHGDPRVSDWEAGSLVAGALSILDRVAPDTAAGVAERMLAARARHPGSGATLEVALDVVSRAADDDVGAALRRLRKALPAATELGRPRIHEHPIVVRLAREKPEGARAAVELAASKVLGAPGAWKKISEKDASFGAVLVQLFDALGATTEAAALRSHPHWMIARTPRA